ncbi:MAG: GNAT family N-acetyltransferase, partial [Candidatus Eremiobacteraeota bacterium]|nr:GNAT family N-acetyltransferase [Candidatus Eremiobacteraeota bacterium]
MPVIQCKSCLLRPWRDDDVEALQAWADDAEVARYVTQRFPYPYTLDDARAWIEFNRNDEPLHNFAIDVGGSAVGSIGVREGQLEETGTAMVGYVLGKAAWGKGLATEALRGIVPYAFSAFKLHRLAATVMGPNKASARVLEKAGFAYEATLRRGLTD